MFESQRRAASHTRATRAMTRPYPQNFYAQPGPTSPSPSPRTPHHGASSFPSYASDSDLSERSCPEVRIDIPGSDDPNIDRLLEPRRLQDGVLRCRVRRLREKNILELFIEEGNIFVLSAKRKGKDWLISDQQQGCDARKHLVRMRTGKDRTFSCARGRYDGVTSPPELVHVRHSTQQLSDDLPDLNVMKLAMPRPPLGSLEATCGLLESRLLTAVERRERAPEDMTILESRSPKWNGRTETYELPFGGRANWASARNFQLIERGGASDRVVLLYGKMEEDEFALDLAYPLSVLNAFAIVLTSWGW